MAGSGLMTMVGMILTRSAPTVLPILWLSTLTVSGTMRGILKWNVPENRMDSSHNDEDENILAVMMEEHWRCEGLVQGERRLAVYSA